jgi:maltose alpha-D-glucosyltransferase/alpha-amylase
MMGVGHPNLDPKILPSAEIDTTIQFGDRFVLKLLRRVESGIHPGVELGEFLTERHPFPNAAPFSGFLEYQPERGDSTVLSLLHAYVPHQGDGWSYTRNELVTFLGRADDSKLPKSEFINASPAGAYNLDFALAEPPDIARDLIGPALAFAENTGKRVAQLHLTLLNGSGDPSFEPEVFNDFYRQGLYHANISLTSRRLEFLRQRYTDMAPAVRTAAARILELEPAIITKFKAVFERRVSSVRIRFHGRLHLGHLLVTPDDDVCMFDFEGEPSLHISERRIKRCPLRDVASMLLSFGYATQTTGRHLVDSELRNRVDAGTFRIWGRFWYSHVSAAFLRGYWRTAGQALYMPPTQPDQQVLLDNYLLERALLDVRSDISEKPDLAGVPFRVILHLLSAEETQPAEPEKV